MDFECQVNMNQSRGSDDGEALDPRIKLELDYLNNCSAEINSLELLLDGANLTFRQTLNEYSQKLKAMKSKIGKSISVARPFFEIEEAAHEAKLECENAAVRFHRACSAHKEAREAIAIAEKKFNSRQDDCQFDTTWQEMLNRETEKLMNAETLKKSMEEEHRASTEHYAQLVSKLKYYEQHHKSAINKSKSYFEQKKLFMRVLDDLKERVESLQKAVHDAKGSYANCLRNLEMISKEIHDKRSVKLPPREPGVGAEFDSESQEPEDENKVPGKTAQYSSLEDWDPAFERLKLDNLSEDSSLKDFNVGISCHGNSSTSFYSVTEAMHENDLPPTSSNFSPSSAIDNRLNTAMKSSLTDPAESQNNCKQIPVNQPAVPDNQPAIPDNQPAIPDNQPAISDNQPAIPDANVFHDVDLSS